MESKQKKILFVVPRMNIGGAETYVATLALGLQQAGLQIHIASGGGKLARLLVRQGIVHHLIRIRRNEKLAAYALQRIVEAEGIDLIHANSAAAGIAAVALKEKLDIPIVYTAHGVFGHAEREKGINKCDKIICVSKYLEDYELSKGFLPEKFITIYSGIDLQKFQPGIKEKSIIRNKLGLAHSDFVIALVARIKNLQNKGHEDMLNIMERYVDTKNWQLVVIGKGKGLWKLKWQIWRRGLSGRVHCLGHITQVEQVLDGMDVVVLPSKHETFGLVLAEAMAMKKPVVTYDVGGTSEVIADKLTGFLVQKENLDELHEKLLLLAQDQELRIEMGEKARQWVVDNFSIEAMTASVLAVYQPLLQEK